MRVKIEKETLRIKIGDIVDYKNIPCMIIGNIDMQFVNILALDDEYGGFLIQNNLRLDDIQNCKLLIPNHKVVIKER